MRRYSFLYFLGQSVKGLWRNGVMSLASITVLMSCLIVMGSFGLLVTNINTNLENLGSLNEIVAFVEQEKKYKEGDTAKLPQAVTPKDANLTFLGWSHDPESATAEYPAGATYKAQATDSVNGNIVFYAVWGNTSVQEGIRLQYSASGTVLAKDSQLPTDDTAYADGDVVALPPALVARYINIEFKGWSLIPVPGENDKIYAGGETVTIHKDDAKAGKITLYAVWSENTTYTEFRMIYDMNGQEVDSLPTDESIRLADVQEKLNALPNVDAVKLITKEETKAEELEKLSEYPDLVAQLQNDENFYPNAFQISYKDNNKVEGLKYQIENIDGIYKINCRSDIADTVENIKNGIILVFAWFMVILFVVSVFVIINTVKLSVFSRRQEISVMRYVGATNWFISVPFLIEGTIIGLLSGTIAYFIEEFMYKRVVVMLTSQMSMIALTPFSSLRPYVFGGFLAIGVLTGVIGSSISLRKYMKA